MKKISIIILALLFSINLSAQKGQAVVGVSLFPNVTKGIDFESSTFTFGGGFYFDYQFSKRFGVSTGVNYLPIKYTDKSYLCFDCIDCCPSEINTSFDIVEIPLKLFLNINLKEDAKYKFYFST